MPRPAEPHASFRGKEVSEAQRPQHLDTTPEADKIFLEINRGQAGGGSTSPYLRQTAPPPRAPEDSSVCPCTRREGGAGRAAGRECSLRAAKLPPTPVLPVVPPPGPRPPPPGRRNRSKKHRQARPELNGRQRCPPGPVPARAGARGPEVRRSAPAGTPRAALGWEPGWRPWAPRSQAGVAGTRGMPVTRRGWPARVPGSPPTRSAEPSTLVLPAAALK